MKRLLLPARAVIVLTTVMLAMTWGGQNIREIVGLTPEQVPWFTPAHYKDGRQRAQLIGDSSQGGA
jgi:hypothetical protein